jgi:tRNA modification GTPase
VISEIMRALSRFGVRRAAAGEFTRRAFINGRMDLTQAEAVIDLIESESPAAVKNAAGQLYGAISTKMGSIYDGLLDIIAHFHAVIDYPDEDISKFDFQKYHKKLTDTDNALRRMLDTHERSKLLRTGIPAVIIGRPNTGKSSLLNALLGYDRAIVTDIAGTTRDTIEEKLLIGNILLRLTDTAGLRKPKDSIEKLGVERTFAALRGAKLCILVFDGSEPLRSDDYDILRSIPPDIPKIAVVNKSDLPSVLELSELDELCIEYCRVSALSGEGLSCLDGLIKKKFPEFENSPSGDLITNGRQAEAISRAADSLSLAAAAFNDGVTPDAVLTDIEAALEAIGEVTGKTMREDMISRIFERFCVGK